MAAVAFHRCMTLTASSGWIGSASVVVGKSLCGIGKAVIVWNCFQEIVLDLYSGQRLNRQHMIEVLETVGFSVALAALGFALQNRQMQCTFNYYFS